MIVHSDSTTDPVPSQTNCLTETLYDFALERARFLDDFLEREKKPFGPLHGLPVSLKDSFFIKGVDTSIGYVSFLEHGPAKRNAPLVDILLNLGAVIYVKTNIPQTLMVRYSRLHLGDWLTDATSDR